MKIIFLDIDGVLNRSDTTELVDGIFTGIEHELLVNLRHIVEETDARLVLASSWRDFDGYDNNHSGLYHYLVNTLDKENMEIFSKTPDLCFSEMYDGRGKEILTWLRKYKTKHQIEKFIIIDDEPFDYKETGLWPYLVKTTYKYGLTKAKAKKAIEMLSS